MEILSNFSSAYCFVSFILGAVFMLTILSIAAMGKVQEPMNKVHFYVARDKNGELWLYIGKPFRDDAIFHGNADKQVSSVTRLKSERFSLNPNDFKDLKWEDEPIEVFLNLED